MAVEVIREKCRQCSPEGTKQIRECSIPDCSLYPYRMGKRPKGFSPPLKAIRKKCLWCCNGSNDEIKHCQVPGCSLWPYRFGCKPTVAEKRGQGPVNTEEFSRQAPTPRSGDDRSGLAR